MTTYLINGKIVLEHGILGDHILAIQDGVISDIYYEDEVREELLEGEIIDLQKGYICPGWIDIHCHGAMGYDTMDGDLEGMKKFAQFKASQGVTGFIPTGITNPLREIEKAIQVVHQYATAASPEGAKILGFHVEGPFINPAKKGAHQAEMIIGADADWTRQMQAQTAGRLIVTVAPEREGVLAYIREMSEAGVLIAVGHSDGTYEEIKAAYEAGASHGVHTFNGMRGLHHREPGVVGGIMNLPLAAEVILDGIHLHPVVVEILSKLKLPDGLILVTDAMRAAGLADGEYDLGGLNVTKVGKEARLADGTLAGSTLTMQEAVRNAVELVGLSINDTMRMAATNPAQVLGLAGQKGSIELGKDADLTLLTPELAVRETIVEGRVVYRKSVK